MPRSGVGGRRLAHSTTPRSRLVGVEELREHLPGGVRDHSFARVVVEQRRHEMLRLLEIDVRGKRRHARIGFHFQNHRTVGGEGLVPRIAHTRWAILAAMAEGTAAPMEATV